MSYNYGGIENFILNYYKEINREYIQFDFVNPYNKSLAFEKQIIELGGKIYHIPNFRKKPFAYKRKLSKIMEHYDIVHIHMLSAANIIPLQVASKKKIKKIIAHAHSTNTDNGIRSILHKFNYKKISKLANIFFFFSNKKGKLIFENGINFQVINNAILLEKYSFSSQNRDKIRKELHIENQTILYGNVGCLNFAKNHVFLLRVYSEILKKQPNSRLCIVGTGELQEAILNLSKELNIEDKVFMLGKRMDVDMIYSAFDCMILPSVYEGFPLTLVEAQANGLKCYVSQDKVPAEVKLIDSLEFISLAKSPSEWAEIIIEGNQKRERNPIDKLRKLHYDIKVEAKWLGEKYLE